MISSSKRDSCSELVAGNYDVIVDDDLVMTSHNNSSSTTIINNNNNNNNNHDNSNNSSNNNFNMNNIIQNPEKNINDINFNNKSKPKTFTNDLKSILKNYLEQYDIREAEFINTPKECTYLYEFKLLKEFSRSLKEDKINLIDGELHYNSRKNRYKDIIPFNHTRVILNSDPSIPGSEYINANFIKGQSGNQQAYIACQGPLPCTLDDFWRMIWECNVSIIIMACNQHESGKPKCELYWPEEVGTSEIYGNIRVNLVRVRQICSDFLIRKFSIDFLEPKYTTTSITNIHDNNNMKINHQSNKDNDCNQSPPPPPRLPLPSMMNDHFQQVNNNDNNNHQESIGADQLDNPIINNNNNNNLNCDNDVYVTKTTIQAEQQQDQQQHQNNSEPKVIARRTICQFHYTTWPDHGAPDSVQPILDLVRLLREVQPLEDKPILVHCSAGCGRTGTICCIDYVWGLLKSNKLDEDFNLCKIISEMRQQRMSMVQTLEQYILCHRVVAALFMKYLKELESINMVHNLMEHETGSLIDNHNHDERDIAVGNGVAGSVSRNSPDDEHEPGPVFI